jgi:hypothetical protein
LGEESAFSSVFAPDTLQEQIGVEAKAARAEVLVGQAAFSWVETMAEDTPIVFASSDAGGIVALTITESETVKPAASGAAITTEGAIKILSGRDGPALHSDPLAGLIGAGNSHLRVQLTKPEQGEPHGIHSSGWCQTDRPGAMSAVERTSPACM